MFRNKTIKKIENFEHINFKLKKYEEFYSKPEYININSI